MREPVCGVNKPGEPSECETSRAKNQAEQKKQVVQQSRSKEARSQADLERMATEAPSCASRVAIAFPRPVPPPVTSATCPLKVSAGSIRSILALNESLISGVCEENALASPPPLSPAPPLALSAAGASLSDGLRVWEDVAMQRAGEKRDRGEQR